MSLLQKLYGAYLTDLKEKICRDPDGDFTQNIQELADKFRKREEIHKKSVVDELFLTLYDQDNHSLKTDLCKLRAFEPAKKAASSEKQRRTLLQCLYAALSPYIAKNCGGIIEMCKMRNQGVEIAQETYEKILEDFKEEVLRDPDADFTPRIQALADEVIKLENECKKSVIVTLLLNLYERDIDSLTSVLARLITLKPAKKAGLSERTDLLPCLCGALSSHMKEDFSDLIAMCGT